MDRPLKVGELARRTGLSVRTLHHYDEIGLLAPRERTAAGHRLYGAAEVRRLQHIASLRQLGLSLEEIGRCLDRPELTLEGVLGLQIERLRSEMERQARLCSLLEELRAQVAVGGPVSIDDMTRTVEATLDVERHFPPEQLAYLARRRDQVGEGRIEDAQHEWADLFRDFAAAMDEGLPPEHPDVARLAERAHALVHEFTGGDPGVSASLRRMYAAEGGEATMARFGMRLPQGLWGYMQAAGEALGG